MKPKAILPFLVLFAAMIEPTDPAAGSGGGEAPPPPSDGPETNQAPPAPFSADDRGNVVDFYDAKDEIVGKIDREAEVDGVQDCKTFEAFHRGEELEAWMRENDYGDELDEIRAGAFANAAMAATGGDGPTPYPGPQPEEEPARPESNITLEEWFGAIQKWAQFNGRPIPELNAKFREAFDRALTPDQAAEALCLQKTDYANANRKPDA